jgi:heterodisulfide reductase subunit C
MGDPARIAGAQGGAQLTSRTSLRSIVLTHTGQDVNRCCSCALCEEITDEAGDVSLSMLMQWILANDERALTSNTVWSDEVLQQADHACANQLDIPAVLLALRNEANRRGLHQGV